MCSLGCEAGVGDKRWPGGWAEGTFDRITNGTQSLFKTSEARLQVFMYCKVCCVKARGQFYSCEVVDFDDLEKKIHLLIKTSKSEPH